MYKRQALLLLPGMVFGFPRDNSFQFFFTISCAQSAEPDESFLPCAFDGGVFPSLDLVSLLLQLLQKNFKVLRLLCKDGVDDSAQAVTVASSRRVNDALLPFPIRLVLDGGELMFQADQIAQPLYCKGGKPEIFELPGPIQGSAIINNVVVNRNCAM